VPQLTTALSIAENAKWITRDEATKLFCFFASYLGYEIDPQEQIDAALAAPPPEMTDYDKLLNSPFSPRTEGQGEGATPGGANAPQ